MGVNAARDEGALLKDRTELYEGVEDDRPPAE